MRNAATIAKVTILAVAVLVTPAMAKDRGFFNCFHLSKEQKEWFTTQGVKSCCDLSDGMPTRYEERGDGTFVPPFEQAYFEAAACRDNPEDDGWPHVPTDDDRSRWVKVDNDRILRKGNPIGPAIAWWMNAGDPTPDTEHSLLCFDGQVKG